MRITKLGLACLCWSLLVTCTIAADEFALGVRTSPHLTPAEEQKSFILPPGFEIQLFAAEPDIAKPLNMAFDDRGRLWITNTVEYPYAAPDDRPGRDSIRILEDTNHDGRADKITTFAEGLNIPMGLLPYQDGVLVFSIPNIWHLRDTNRDGKADTKTKLYGPFGVDRDVHGLNNAFRRNYDGWVYACHGYNNFTTVKGTDGHEITMHSGNTYRFRLDGSRIEHFTHGQVNPYGMAFDSQGDIFTADCHSKPIYQLLRGGYYPSFGRPHNGLGYVPPMMEHLHGSTAISGISVYEDDRFPADLQGTVFSGNVMTSRINRNSLVRHGSTYIAKEEDDFLETTDSWFRPVDIQLGPDGALYVADFYNRIIGHYEVPLEHEGRDRTSGRIWRIVKSDRSEPRSVDLAAMSRAELVQTLASPNQTLRFLTMNRLVDNADKQTGKQVNQFIRNTTSPAGRSCGLWVLQRLGKLDEKLLEHAANDKSATVRIHTLKILAERAEWSAAQRQQALVALQDKNAFVRRAAVDALMLHPRADQLSYLIETLRNVELSDTHLQYAMSLALLSNLECEEGFNTLEQLTLSDSDRKAIASILLASSTPEAATFLLHEVANLSGDEEQFTDFLQHIARNLPAAEVSQLVALVREKVASKIDIQAELLLAVASGQRQQGAPLDEAIQRWGDDLAAQLLESAESHKPAWENFPHQAGNGSMPWGIRTVVPSEDGQHDSPFIDSRPGGESATGVYRSPRFSIPSQLSFYLAGHRGFPEEEPNVLNRFELHDAQTGELLAQAFPPRNDTAKKVDWQLSDEAGREGYLEIVDTDSADAYAWLAVGRFEPEVVSLPNTDPAVVSKRLEAAAQLADELQLTTLQPLLAQMLQSGNLGLADEQTVAKTLASLAKDSRLLALIPALTTRDIPADLRQQIADLLSGENLLPIAEVLSKLAQAVPSSIQQQMAEQLILDQQGAVQLLQLVEAGRFSPRVLLQPVVNQALPQLLSKQQAAKVQTLTADLPPLSEKIQATISTRLEAYPQAETSLDRGRQAFEKHCSICHRIGTQGTLIGPQLDGIGSRGSQRLLEDMLDPNRNVDAAFRTSTIVLDSGKVLTGLFRRKEGALLVFAGNDGKEFSVVEEEIDERIESKISLMPSGFESTVDERTFYDLLAFLLAERGK